MIAIIVAIAKTKPTAMKSNIIAVKIRLLLFKLLHDKKMLRNVHAIKADKKVKD